MSGALAQKYHGWDNRAKQRLEKRGLKVNIKERWRSPWAARVPQLVCNIEIIVRSCNAVEHVQVKPKMTIRIILKGIFTLEQSTNSAFPSWTSFFFISLITLFSFIPIVSFHSLFLHGGLALLSLAYHPCFLTLS